MNRIRNSKKSTKHTFNYFAHKWLKEYASKLKLSSFAKYRNIVNLYLLPYLGAMMIVECNRKTVGDLTTRLLTSGGSCRRGLQPSTVDAVLTVLKSILEYASSETGCSLVNFQKLRVNFRTPSVVVLRRSEQKRLSKWLLENLSPCNIGVLLCLTSGLRIGEVCALRWSDIMLDENSLLISHTLSRRQTFALKGKRTEVVRTSLKSAFSERKIPLPSKIVDILSRERRENDVYVLTGASDRFMEPRSLNYHFQKILCECHIRHVKFHTLRHSFATRWVEKGYDIKMLSEILGHSSVNITLKYYVHPSFESKRQCLSKFIDEIIS